MYSLQHVETDPEGCLVTMSSFKCYNSSFEPRAFTYTKLSIKYKKCTALKFMYRPSVEHSSSWDVPDRLFATLLCNNQNYSVLNSWPRCQFMTRICLSGSMRAAVTDETAQGGTLTAFVASVPSIIGFWYAGFDIQLSPSCQ